MPENQLVEVQESKPLAAEFGGKTRSMVGFSPKFIIKHLSDHAEGVDGLHPSCSPSCLAKHVRGKDTKLGREEAKRSLAPAFKAGLDDGIFIVKEYEPPGSGHGRLIGWKKFEGTEIDIQNALVQLERAKRRKELNEEYFHRANCILQTFARTEGQQ